MTKDKKYAKLLKEIILLQKENERLKKELTMAEDMISFYQDEQYEEK